MIAQRFARVLIAAGLVALPSPAAAQASAKPLLSKEIQSVFEKRGADAARQR